jgi:hypothetical protein
VRQTLSPDLDAGALVSAFTEFGDGKNLVEIVSAGRFDRRGFLFRRKKSIAKRWLLQQVQKIGHVAPTAGSPRCAKAAHDPVRGSFTPELVAFSLNARHPVDDGSPHWFGDINSFRIGLWCKRWRSSQLGAWKSPSITQRAPHSKSQERFCV